MKARAMKALLSLAPASILILAGCNLLVEFRPPHGDASGDPGTEADPADDEGDRVDLQDEGEDVPREEADPSDPADAGEDAAEEADAPVEVEDEEILDAPEDIEPEEAQPVCGNGIVEGDEACDPPGGPPSDCATSCASTGTRTCADGCEWNACVAPEEICNGLDDDCMSGPDDGFPCPAGRTVACTSVCGSEGTGVCADDCTLPGAESCDPPAEACNGLDDTCDGTADEGFECVRGTAARSCVNPVGVAGAIECDASCLWTPCCGTEDCGNGYDDNCDGAVDEPGRMGSQIRVTDDPGLSARASAVWTGSEIAVAWHDNRDGQAEIYLARLTPLGEKIGADIRLTDAAGASEQPSLRWTGSELAAAWSDARDGNAEIYLARATSLGEKIGGDVRITDDASASAAPVLVGAGSQLAVVWVDDRLGMLDTELYLALVSAAGEKTSGDIRLTDAAGTSEMPSLAWTGSRLGVAWKDQRDVDYEIYFALVDETGAKEGSDVRITNAAGGSGSPSLHWTGSHFLLAWCDGRDGAGQAEIYFTAISASGAKETGDVRVTTAPQLSSFPSAQWTGSELGVTWKDARSSPLGEIFFTRLGEDGSRLGSDVGLSSPGGVNEYPSLVWTGSAFAAAWHGTLAGNPEIYLALIGCG
jgi:hypothetical protein